MKYTLYRDSRRLNLAFLFSAEYPSKIFAIDDGNQHIILLPSEMADTNYLNEIRKKLCVARIDIFSSFQSLTVFFDSPQPYFT